MEDKKTLLDLTWPIFLESVLFSLMGSADVLMLSGYSDNAVGAVGIVNQILFSFLVIARVITAGSGILCAQYIGANKEKKDIKSLIFTGIFVNGILGSCFSIFLVLGYPLLFQMMGIDPVMYEYARDYMLIIGSTLFVQFISMTVSSFLRSYGKTKETMLISVLTNLCNIILNYILIYGKLGLPSLGVSGAAIATALCNLLGCVAFMIFLGKRIMPGFYKATAWEENKAVLKVILQYGMPAAGEQFSYTMAKLCIMAIITRIGVAAVTTYSYLNTIVSFVYLFAMAVGQGSGILIGWKIGGKEREKAYEIGIFSTKLSLIISMLITLVLFFLRRPMMGIFTKDQEIIALGVMVLASEFLLEAGRSVNLVLVNGLRAMGDVNFPLYIGLFSMWFFAVGFSFLLGIPLGMGLLGVWIALGLDEVFRAVGMAVKWRKNFQREDELEEKQVSDVEEA
ncbi:MAG: MATE family efflux transporter [Roseburia sp.]|nr:MATE family efflux transporter [Roseburia sp.]MCM1279829.1 MATE family efflux transporter [Robinsoniella sp.]